MNKKYDADKNKALLYSDHPKPRSRREFLASGLIGATSLAFGPDLFNIFKLSPTEVMAQEGPSCIHDKMCGNIPYMCFDAAGGMNIPGGNVIVGFGAGEDQEDFGMNIALSDFIKMGLPSEMHPSLSGMIDNSYGIKFHSTSGLLEGMNSVLAPEMDGDPDLRNSIDGVFICSILSDDTGNNPINTAHMARKAGVSGDLVQLIGNRNTDTGGNSTAPQSQIDLMYKPSTIRRFQDSESLISIGDKMMGSEYLNASDPALGAKRLKAFMETARKIGLSKFERLAESQERIAAKNKVGATLGSTKAVFDKYAPADLNPSKNATDLATLNPIFGVEQADGSFTIGRSEEQVATIANLVTKRIAGTATVTLGGYDYHNGTAATGNMRDYQMGRYIGQCIKLAAARGQNMFIHLLTDGGCVGDSGGAIDTTPEGKGRIIWTSDSGTRSGALLLAYKHGHNRIDAGETSSMMLAGKKRQIGYFVKGGGVVKGANSVSNSAEQLWKAIILNYFACMTDSTDDDEIIRIAGEAFEDKFGDLPPDWQSLIRFRSLVA